MFQMKGLRTDISENEDNKNDNPLPSLGSTFLIVYHEAWQQILLLKYGNMPSLMDAVYKTTKYALPLFLVCVRTNCGYIPMAQFIIEQESAFHIAEGL